MDKGFHLEDSYAWRLLSLPFAWLWSGHITQDIHCMGKKVTESPVFSSEFSIVSLLALQRGSTSRTSDLGSWLPANMASMMTLPDLSKMSLMTVSTLIFISTSDFCMCWILSCTKQHVVAVAGKFANFAGCNVRIETGLQHALAVHEQNPFDIRFVLLLA